MEKEVESEARIVSAGSKLSREVTGIEGTHLGAVVTHNILHRLRGDEVVETMVQCHGTTLSAKRSQNYSQEF